MSLKDTYSEISEKRTSKLGYLILIALFMFIVGIGQTIFGDISNIPNRPDSPSYCVSTYLSNLENLTYKPSCYFNDTDREFGLSQIIEEINPTLIEVVDLNSDIKSKERELNRFDNSDIYQEYELSLMEDLADEEGILDTEELQADIVKMDAEAAALAEEIASLKLTRDELLAGLEPQLSSLEVAYEDADDYYETQNAWYSLKVFILQLFFVLPFFGFFLWLYLKHKRKDSPYTIIITSIFFASIALFLEIVVKFLYGVLPKEWFARIFEFLMAVAVLKYIVYYGSVALVILVLGGIVFFIQRNLYDPKRVALRSLKDNKCPNCSLTLELSEQYCAKCGHQIKETCDKCQRLKFVNLDYCPHCGK